MIAFAHLSDIHLDGSERRARRAAAVMAYLNGLTSPLEAVLVTGDIADNGLASEYEQARAILWSVPWPVLPCPVLPCPVCDPIRQSGEHRLASLMAAHPQVAATFCGHAHTPAATTFAGRPMLAAPGVASTLRLPWERGQIADERTPPSVAFHILADGRMTTHYRVVAEDLAG